MVPVGEGDCSQLMVQKGSSVASGQSWSSNLVSPANQQVQPAIKYSHTKSQLLTHLEEEAQSSIKYIHMQNNNDPGS